MIRYLPYLFVTVILVVYFIWYPQIITWPQSVLAWVWLPYILHVYLHNFVDGLQNTTRNIARIYLIKNYGPNYDMRLIDPVQRTLIPYSMLPVIILWQATHVSSFALLLFYQGWGTALVAEFALTLFGVFIPIRYQSHLRRIYARVQHIGSNEFCPYR